MQAWSRLLHTLSGDAGIPPKETTPLQQVEARLAVLGTELTSVKPSWQVETDGPKTIVTTNVSLMDGMEPLKGMLAITIEATKISLNNLAGTSRTLSTDENPIIRVPANNAAVDAVMKSFEGDARKANLLAHRQLSEQNDRRSQGSAYNVNQL